MAFYTCVQILFLLKSANDRNIFNPVVYLLSFVLQAIERTIFLLCLRNVHASHVSSMISVLIFRLNIRRHAKRCSSGGKVRHFYLFKMRSENTIFMNNYQTDMTVHHSGNISKYYTIPAFFLNNYVVFYNYRQFLK